MRAPLRVQGLLERAATLFPHKEVVSGDGAEPRRATWRQVKDRAWALASALPSLGVRQGDRVASLAWNTQAHVELYFGVPASGAVLLTANVRLSPELIRHVLAHAEARVVFADPEFVPLVEKATRHVAHPIRKVTLAGAGQGGWLAYDEIVSSGDPGASLPELEEDDAAGLCYTSGTTGEPKGVLYSHRSIVLHTLGICLPDGFGIGETDVVLPAVPMFHANAWGLVHAAAMTGATLVLPGARPSAARLAALLEEERVTFAAGVPTVWMGVLDELRARPRSLSPRLRIHSGGAPTAPALVEAYRKVLGVEIITGWGMTELTPVGMVNHPRAEMADWTPEALLTVRTSQGTPLPLVETRVVDEQGRPVPADGRTPGELEVRGPWVTAGYFRSSGADAFRDGWLRTGDVATQDGLGYVRLVDRTKDLIRSGGEWISSVALEHALMDHPAVGEVAVVAVPHPKWGERPWACVVLRSNATASPADLLESLEGRFPKWWVPDGVVFLEALPRTSTGKFDKRTLRERMRPHG